MVQRGMVGAGVGVYSTTARGFARYSGTSMATPHVAGACALLWSFDNGLSHEDVKDRILGTVEPLSALAGRCLTEGRLNLDRALRDLRSPQILSAISQPEEDDLIGSTVEIWARSRNRRARPTIMYQSMSTVL